LVTMIVGVLGAFEVRIDPSLQQDAAQWLLAAETLLSGGLSLWGRLRASRRIRSGAGPQSWPIKLLLGAALLTPSGCQLLQSPTQANLAADRATFDAIAPEYAAYVANDSALTPDQRARRARTIEAWRMRIESDEATERRRELNTQPFNAGACAGLCADGLQKGSHGRAHQRLIEP